jgi:hypothetical protein
MLNYLSMHLILSDLQSRPLSFVLNPSRVRSWTTRHPSTLIAQSLDKVIQTLIFSSAHFSCLACHLPSSLQTPQSRLYLCILLPLLPHWPWGSSYALHGLVCALLLGTVHYKSSFLLLLKHFLISLLYSYGGIHCDIYICACDIS